MPGWLPWALLALFAAAVFVGWVAWSLHNAPPLRAGIPARYRGLALVYQGQVWVPVETSTPARFSDGAMVRVGRAGGYDLFANPAHGLPSGLARTPGSLETGPWGRVYVRIDDGRYLPLKWRQVPGGAR